ncbi:hypothetical protein HU720_03050 [Pseudomonas sp. SWRI51]|uniref:hypothetical protein n=1 Tax=Pseudomonas sp. SWRI51 TaxID=2745491 RepID=UPI001644CA25|nr:hypothetical protein [Pseudomonas sp. SWRI51]MBC3410275.1 hypothetical protein [Pseudomonas sp. SWRI51]
MNFHVKVEGGYAAGVMPSVKLADGWREGEELFVLTADGWRTVWRRQVVFINTLDRAGASIFELMGSPTRKRHYVFINRATLYGGTSGFALRTGVFPAGSTLTIINEGAIRGAGGAGAYPAAAGPGKGALLLECDTALDNRAGLVYGGGGGGGWRYLSQTLYAGGGGGAGRPGGAAGGMYQNSTYTFTRPGAGTDDVGGAGGRYSSGHQGGAGGAPGEAGVTVTSVAGAGGYAIDRAGHVLSIIAGGEAERLKGVIV